ncbi:MAG: hypothetical protein RL016_471 [Actinomycetota bacterium]|jgi:hypothetical protein
MSKKFLMKLAIATALTGVGFATSVVPAQAAGMTCYTPSDNGTLATGACTGISAGYVQLNVVCPAIWPFTPWVDYGSWVYVNGSVYVSNSHVWCGVPVSLSYQVR